MRLLWAFILLSNFSFAQDISEKIRLAGVELQNLELQKQKVQQKIESLKLEKIRFDLDASGLPQVQPSEQLVRHKAMFLSYSPEYKQARWVAHIITPDVITGTVFRTNDFRVDSAIKGGSAVESDYFLKSYKADSTIVYDGFGYDRGHLAPSADFRWSQEALSESYFYSNMSPQLADFNRGIWGNLEDAIRGYIFRNSSSQLYVVTGPVLENGLSKIERGTNKIPIPNKYWKVVIDPVKNKGIGFILPNKPSDKPLSSYAVSIDEVEKLTGLDFYNKLDKASQESIEKQLIAEDWLPKANSADVEPLAQEKLPRGHFNTTIAKDWSGRNEEITVCGTVVGARISRAGNVLLNLDKQFPNQVFTVFIRKEDIVNFKYQPDEFLKGKVICVKGRVIDQGGSPALYIKNENDLKIR